jgi:hypothetical protein
VARQECDCNKSKISNATGERDQHHSGHHRGVTVDGRQRITCCCQSKGIHKQEELANPPAPQKTEIVPFCIPAAVAKRVENPKSFIDQVLNPQVEEAFPADEASSHTRPRALYFVGGPVAPSKATAMCIVKSQGGLEAFEALGDEVCCTHARQEVPG